MGNPELPEVLERVGGVIGSRMDVLFGFVELVHSRVSDIVEQSAERRRSPDRAALAAIRPLLQELLAADEPLLEGIGVAVSPDTLTDAPRWVEWWRRNPDGSHFITHVLNPDDVGFYDYQSRDWFKAPLATGKAVATGPYIDAGCINACTITLGLPLLVAGRGAAVVGADISLPRLEALLLHTLHSRRYQVVVLAANQRVVVSNMARHVTGSRLRLRSEEEQVIHSLPVPSQDPQRLPWRVLGLGSAVPDSARHEDDDPKLPTDV